MHIKTFLLTAAVAALTISGSADAGLLTIVDATASHGGDRYANGVPSVNNGSGITKSDVNDPSSWSFDGEAYGDELMSNFLSGASNSKVAWEAFDLGSDQVLGDLWIFNTNYQDGISGVNLINVHIASTPSVALPATPAKNTYAANVGASGGAGDYDFSSGGWTKIISNANVTKDGISTLDISGNTARYVAIEILSNHGDTYRGGRVGVDEIAITEGAPVPEPGSLALVGLGGLLIARRRRG